VSPRAFRNGCNELASSARGAFMCGMDEALMIATVVVSAAVLVVLVLLSNRGAEALELTSECDQLPKDPSL